MDILAKIAEQRIREAMERGEFDNLPLYGKPIKLDDLVGVPEHLRMGYKILKNAGVLPEEMQLKKEMVSLKNLLDACYDETEKHALQQKIGGSAQPFLQQVPDTTIKYRGRFWSVQMSTPHYESAISWWSGPPGGP